MKPDPPRDPETTPEGSESRRDATAKAEVAPDPQEGK